MACSVACGSRTTAFSGSKLGCRKPSTASRGAASVVMAKKGIHPEWFPEAKVICNGDEVMTVSGTKPVYKVEIYSGNHPVFLGQKSGVVFDDGRLSKFKSKFAGMDDLFGTEGSGGGKAIVDRDALRSSKAKPKKKK